MTSENVKGLERQERENGFDKLETYQKINENVDVLKNELLRLNTTSKKIFDAQKSPDQIYSKCALPLSNCFF